MWTGEEMESVILHTLYNEASASEQWGDVQGTLVADR